MTSRGGRSPHGPRITSVDQVIPRHRGRVIWLSVVFLAALVGTAASGETAQGKAILAGLQRFMLFYAGVFALIAMTATVGIGLAATDRIIMVPSSRVVAQAVHRAVSLAALGFLFIHIVTEILAHRSHVIDAFIPFLAQRRTFYIGLGTVASDMMLILIVTGLARSRFVGKWPWTWRAIHASAYLCWVFSIVHGLLGGRVAKPYVDWSYGACGAAVVLALIIRLVATVRDRRETAPQPVRASAPSSVPAAMSALAPLQFQATGRAAQQGANALPRTARRALPAAGADSSPAQGYPQQRRRPSPYQERGRPGAQPYRGQAYPGRSAYAPGYADGPASAPHAYQQPPGTGAPPRLALPAGESSAQRPYAPEAYQQPRNPAGHRPQSPYAPSPYAQSPYAQQPYAQQPYAQQPYAQQPYAQQPRPGHLQARRVQAGPPSAGRPGQPPVEHYAVVPHADPGEPEDLYEDDQYADDPYTDDPYDFDFSAPGPELWPEHPSGPMQVYRPVGDSPEYPPGNPEWP